ncbi:hypothetical protein Aperf_G00000109908 [Anoplocephala perfoliata]
MDSKSSVEAQALFDYDRQHFDELSLSHSKFVGKLFLDVAKSMDQLTGEYTRSCAYIEFGLQEHVKAIPVAIGAGGQELYSGKTKALFASVYDRLSRYPILLKETERYYEDPHPDRMAICKAIQVYSEILERCNILRSLREVDIEILSSDIRSLPEQSRAQMGDPTLTLKANICIMDPENHFVIDTTKPQTVVLLYPTFVIILSFVAPRVYQFKMHVPIANISVAPSQQNENVLTLKIVGLGSAQEDHNLYLWCTGVFTRDIFFSTISEFIRNSKDGEEPCTVVAAFEVFHFRTVFLLRLTSSGSDMTDPTFEETVDSNAVQRQRSALRTPLTSTTAGEPSMRRRSGSCRSAGGSHDDTCTSNCGGPHTFALRPSHSGPLYGPEAGYELLPTSSDENERLEPPRIDTVAVTDLTNFPGCRFLPHETKARALVKWPDDILTLSKRQETSNPDGTFNSHNPQRLPPSPQPEESLTHLRLDRAPLQPFGSLLSGDDVNSHQGGARGPIAGGHANRSSRPASPGRSGAVGDGGRGAGKVLRRKRTDEITQRNERDAKILQIIELYCGSGLPKGALKPLDLTQLRLSYTEMRMKENSLPPPGVAANLTAPTASVPPSSRTYENLDYPLTSIRPPPVILPTSTSNRKA